MAGWRQSAWAAAGVAAWLSAAAQAVAACNRHDALESQRALQALDTWKEGATGVDFTPPPQAANLGPTAQVGLIRMFILSDRCLPGAVRPIRFFQHRRLFGTSGPDGRFVPADPAFPMPPEPGWYLWFSFKPFR